MHFLNVTGTFFFSNIAMPIASEMYMQLLWFNPATLRSGTGFEWGRVADFSSPHPPGELSPAHWGEPVPNTRCSCNQQIGLLGVGSLTYNILEEEKKKQKKGMVTNRLISDTRSTKRFFFAYCQCWIGLQSEWKGVSSTFVQEDSCNIHCWHSNIQVKQTNKNQKNTQEAVA